METNRFQRLVSPLPGDLPTPLSYPFISDAHLARIRGEGASEETCRALGPAGGSGGSFT